MKKTGKEIFEENFINKAKTEMDNSGYEFLSGFHYYLLAGNAETTSYNYIHKVIMFLKELSITNKNELKNITLDDYVRYMASIKNRKSSDKNTSYAALKKYSKYLYASKITKDNYMQYVERPKVKETPEQVAKRESGIISLDEFNEALTKVERTCDTDWLAARNKAILKLFMGTGIRRAALYKLDMKDIDFKEGSVTVSEKGEKYRKVFCPPQTIDALKEWIELRDIVAKPGENAVFVSRNKRRISDVNITKIIKQYTGKSPHKMRASFITQVYDKTGDIYLVQKAVDHSSPAVTQLYIRGKNEESARKAADIMKSVMG